MANEEVPEPMSTPVEANIDIAELARKVDLLASHREIEQQIYRMGYHLEIGDFASAGKLLAHSTFGADRTARKQYKGEDEIREAYTRTNIVYPEGGRRSKEIYTSVIIDIDLDSNTATSVTSYTVAHQPPGEAFELMVAGKYEDEWERVRLFLDLLVVCYQLSCSSYN